MEVKQARIHSSLFPRLKQVGSRKKKNIEVGPNQNREQCFGLFNRKCFSCKHFSRKKKWRDCLCLVITLKIIPKIICCLTCTKYY